MNRILNPYNDLYVKNILESSYQGVPIKVRNHARKLINTIKEPYAVALDYSVLIVVIEDRYHPGRHRAEIYRCSENRLSWTYIPIPVRFTVREIKYDDQQGRFYFISMEGNSVGGTPEEICTAMRNIGINANWATEEEIETCFLTLSFENHS